MADAVEVGVEGAGYDDDVAAVEPSDDSQPAFAAAESAADNDAAASAAAPVSNDVHEQKRPGGGAAAAAAAAAAAGGGGGGGEYVPAQVKCYVATWRMSDGYDGKMHTRFVVDITRGGRKYSVKRRYNDFRAVYSAISDHCKRYEFPKFPGKKLLGSSFEYHFLNKRMEELRAWIARVCTVPALVNHAAMQEFLKPDSELPALPEEMNAAYFRRYAQSKEEIKETLEFGLRPLPLVGNNDVLIRVHAASINPVDYKMLIGNLAMVMKSPPHIPGFDVAGTVVRVGCECKRIKVGDPVFCMGHYRRLGGFADYAAMPEKHVAIKPRDLTFTEAATVPLAALTSYQAMIQKGSFQEGQKVLILGGSGGTGHFAVQIAKALRASFVACTCSRRNFDFMRGLGADECIDYHSQDWWTHLQGQDFDLIYDCVGGPVSWEKAPLVLKPKSGRFVTIAGDQQTKLGPGRALKTAAQVTNRKFWGLFGYSKYDLFTTDAARFHDLDVLRAWIEKGQVKPNVERAYEWSLAGLHALYQHSVAGHTLGKIAIKVSKSADEK